ncbi:hypothetical protein ITQ94_09100 [Pediococcus pentosaceus]|uniref:hypothetical protein n=1 Tax=Pediococcus pentosaceus TaxID=1255 RepID=UPI0018FED1A9|nr:hypothetical protein [Pediococcus pentosaceus]MBF7131593.1 hypothetical protein [Pediococcus pentosaceus]DAZ69655.1 MAG TPA: AmfC protein [Caudoviricetes sp.]
MGNLAHYVNKKKLIVLERGEKPALLTVDNILEKYDSYAHSLANLNQGRILRGYNPKYDVDDLYVAILDGIFIAFNKYKENSGTPFIAYAKSHIRTQLGNIKDDINCKKRECDKNAVYADWENDGENLLLSEDDVSKLEICEYIQKTFNGDRFEHEILTICESGMMYGKIDFEDVSKKTGETKKKLANIKLKIRKVLYEENDKTKYFNSLCD